VYEVKATLKHVIKERRDMRNPKFRKTKVSDIPDADDCARFHTRWSTAETQILDDLLDRQGDTLSEATLKRRLQRELRTNGYNRTLDACSGRIRLRRQQKKEGETC
jgi:hypothetical protein